MTAPMSSVSRNKRLSASTLKEVLALPGNGKCFDCDKSFVLVSEVWAVVPYGILCCSACARVHEELMPKGGTRSLVMDYITPRQTLALQIGSNSQLKGFFRRNKIDKTATELLFKLSAAAFYRRQLAMELWRRMGPALAPGKELTESDALKLQDMVLVNGNLNPPPGFADGEFTVRLENLVARPGPLGLTLTETHGGRSLVQRVSAEGIASSVGIRVGDYVVGVGVDREWRFKVVLPKISAWARSSQKVKNGASKTKTKVLLLSLWRPAWRPDAFLMQTVPSNRQSEAEDKRDRTTALLEAARESTAAHGGKDWQSFVAANDAGEHDYGEHLEDVLEEQVTGATETKSSFELLSPNEESSSADYAAADGRLLSDDNVDPSKGIESSAQKCTAEEFPEASDVLTEDGEIKNSEQSGTVVLDLNSHIVSDFFGPEPIAEGTAPSDISVQCNRPSEDPASANTETNGWIAQIAGTRQTIGKGTRGTGISTLPPEESAALAGLKKPKWVAKVGNFFAKLGPKGDESDTRNEDSGSDDDVSYISGSSGTESGDEGEDEEAAAEIRVRELLINQLAGKRSVDVGIKMDIFASEDEDSHESAPVVGPNGAFTVTTESAAQAGALNCRAVVFLEAQLGMVLRKGSQGEATVASVERGSAASREGVVPGDVILGVNACRTSDFSQILWLLRHVERPMHLLLHVPQ